MSRKNSPLFFGLIANILAILSSILLIVTPMGDQLGDRGVKPFSKKKHKLSRLHVIEHAFYAKSDPFELRNLNTERPIAPKESFCARIATRISGDSTLSNTTESLLLINYIQQFNPTNNYQLSFIFQVASDAQQELNVEWLTASENLRKKRVRLEDLVGQVSAAPYYQKAHLGQWFQSLQTYLDKLDERRLLNKRIALQLEKIDGLNAQAAFVELAEIRSESSWLQEEKVSVQADQGELSALDRELASLETELFMTLADFPQSVSAECTALLKEYKSEMGALSEQEIIVNKFEIILAASQYVDFSTI